MKIVENACKNSSSNPEIVGKAFEAIAFLVRFDISHTSAYITLLINICYQ